MRELRLGVKYPDANKQLDAKLEALKEKLKSDSATKKSLNKESAKK